MRPVDSWAAITGPWDILAIIALISPSPIGSWWRAEWDPSGMALGPLELMEQKTKGQTGFRRFASGGLRRASRGKVFHFGGFPLRKTFILPE